ncbi:MAG: M28 family peptidase, partial [Chitinophagales bacterium]
ADPLRIYYRSDHYNFARKGVPVIFYFDGIHQDYHKPTDTPDKINYDLLEKRARLVFYTAWEMANRNEMMKRDLKLEGSER